MQPISCDWRCSSRMGCCSSMANMDIDGNAQSAAGAAYCYRPTHAAMAFSFYSVVALFSYFPPNAFRVCLEALLNDASGGRCVPPKAEAGINSVPGVARNAWRSPDLVAPKPTISPRSLIPKAVTRYNGESFGTRPFKSAIRPLRQRKAR